MYSETDSVGYCEPYSKDSTGVNSFLSASHVAGAAFAVIATIFGGLAILSLTCQIFVKLRNVVWYSTGYILISSFLFQSLSFLVLNSDRCKDSKTQCRIGRGGELSIVATILYFGTGFTIIKMSAPNNACIAFDVSSVMGPEKGDKPTDTKNDSREIDVPMAETDKNHVNDCLPAASSAIAQTSSPPTPTPNAPVSRSRSYAPSLIPSKNEDYSISEYSSDTGSLDGRSREI